MLPTPADAPGPSLVEITTRTIQSRFLLSPAPTLTPTTIGILARATARYAVQVHAFAFLSNHYHLIATAADAHELAGFVCYLNSNLAREAGRLHGWDDRFWSRRYQVIPISDEPEAQLARLQYVLSHGVKEGLVASPLDWPGAHCARALAEGTTLVGHWHDRTGEFRARQRGLRPLPGDFVNEERLELVPLPALAHLDRDQQRDVVREMIRSIEERGAAERATSKIQPLGRAAILRQDPQRIPRRTKESPAPRVHAFRPEIIARMREAYRLFLEAFRRASAKLRAGLDVHFPEGSFPPALPFVRARDG